MPVASTGGGGTRPIAALFEDGYVTPVSRIVAVLAKLSAEEKEELLEQLTVVVQNARTNNREAQDHLDALLKKCVPRRSPRGGGSRARHH